MASCSVVVARENMIATTADVTAALKDNACMIELMPRRAAASPNPLSLHDLDKGKHDCSVMYDTHYAKIEQKKAMAQAGGKK